MNSKALDIYRMERIRDKDGQEEDDGDKCVKLAHRKNKTRDKMGKRENRFLYLSS